MTWATLNTGAGAQHLAVAILPERTAIHRKKSMTTQNSNYLHRLKLAVIISDSEKFQSNLTFIK